MDKLKTFKVGDLVKAQDGTHGVVIDVPMSGLTRPAICTMYAVQWYDKDHAELTRIQAGGKPDDVPFAQVGYVHASQLQEL